MWSIHETSCDTAWSSQETTIWWSRLYLLTMNMTDNGLLFSSTVDCSTWSNNLSSDPMFIFCYICYPVDVLWTIVFARIESKNELRFSSFHWTKYFLLSRLVHLNRRRHCLFVSIMALDPRSKRTVKRKAIYSPSDPSRPEYHLIHVQELQKDFIVKTSSIKQQTNGNVSISVGGEDKRGQLITSGMYCSFDLQWRQWTRRWERYMIGLLFRHQSLLRDRIQLTITWCGTRWDGRSNRFWRKCDRRLVKIHSFF